MNNLESKRYWLKTLFIAAYDQDSDLVAMCFDKLDQLQTPWTFQNAVTCRSRMTWDVRSLPSVIDIADYIKRILNSPEPHAVRLYPQFPEFEI